MVETPANNPSRAHQLGDSQEKVPEEKKEEHHRTKKVRELSFGNQKAFVDAGFLPQIIGSHESQTNSKLQTQEKTKETAVESAKKIYKFADAEQTTSAQHIRFKVKGSYNNYVR